MRDRRIALSLTLSAVLVAGACVTFRSDIGAHDAGIDAAPENVPLPLRAPRTPRESESEAALGARAAFWEAFRAERYDALPGVLRLLNLAVLENPGDAESVLLLGHAHLWMIAERARATTPDPALTEHLVLADHYFEEAWRLAPGDHRILGWLGSARLPLATIRQDPERAAEGARLLEEGVLHYPAFNLFTAAYTRSGLPAHDQRFQAALEMLWRNVDACSGARDADDGEVYELARQADRSCANSPKAPHNFEGFVMHLGDMLIKSGDAERALSVYARAESSPSFGSWPYRETLEARIRDADDNAARAREGQPIPMMPGSAYACAGCHAAR